MFNFYFGRNLNEPRNVNPIYLCSIHVRPRNLGCLNIGNEQHLLTGIFPEAFENLGEYLRLTLYEVYELLLVGKWGALDEIWSYMSFCCHLTPNLELVRTRVFRLKFKKKIDGRHTML